MGFFQVFNTLLQSVNIQKRSSNLPRFPNIFERVIFFNKAFCRSEVDLYPCGISRTTIKTSLRCWSGFLKMGEKNQRLKAGMHSANIPADNEHPNSPQHSLDTRVYQ